MQPKKIKNKRRVPCIFDHKWSPYPDDHFGICLKIQNIFPKNLQMQMTLIWHRLRWKSHFWWQFNKHNTIFLTFRNVIFGQMRLPVKTDQSVLPNVLTFAHFLFPTAQEDCCPEWAGDLIFEQWICLIKHLNDIWFSTHAQCCHTFA